MLCAYLPFRDPDRNKLFRKIRKGKFEFSGDKWLHVSDDAKDFIRRLLTTVPANRISSADALQHRWLALEGSAGKLSVEEDTVVVDKIVSTEGEGTEEPSTTSTNNEDDIIEGRESDNEAQRSKIKSPHMSTMMPIQQLVVSM